MGLQPGLAKHAAVGIGIQSDFDTPNTSVTWLPFTDTFDFNREENVEVLEVGGELSDWQYLTWSPGTHFTGTIAFALQPGVVGTLFQWVLDRDSYNQPTFATIAKYDPKEGVITVQDVLAATAALTLDKGAIVTMSVTAHGRKEAATSAAAPTSSDVVRGLPYLVKECVLQVDTGSGYTTNETFENLTINIDNLAEDPAEGRRIAEADYPLTMYTTGGMRVTGTITRDYIDDTFASIVEDQRNNWTESTPYSSRIAIKVTATRGSNSLVIELPYVQFTSRRVDLPANTNDRLQEVLEFSAMTDSTGTTAPLSVTIDGTTVYP